MKKLFKALWAAFVLITPLLGVWLGSSLASYLGGPRWAAIAVGGLLFPLLPLVWEARATRRFKRKNAARAEKGKAERKRFLSLGDRIVARTLSINIAFVALLVVMFPAATFPALSTRGAWFLDDNPAPYADTGRRVLFSVAEGLEWLYRLTHENPYTKLREGEDDGDDKPAPPPKPVPSPVRPTPDKPTPDKPNPDKPNPDKPNPDKPNPDKPNPDKPNPNQPGPVARDGRPVWPAPHVLDPRAQNVPASATTSVRALGQHFKTIEPAFERVRVMHDWVADNIAYDWPSVEDGSYVRKQQAAQVLQTRKGVCSGYSNLMVALGNVTGDRIVYVAGDAKDMEGETDDVGHAWNAVKIGQSWFLFDVTWNSGKNVGRKHERFKTTYFLTPPKEFALNHFPDKPKWQLLEKPLSRGAFLRQPAVRPEFVARGLGLVSPSTGVGRAGQSARVELSNPQGWFVLGEIRRRDGSGKRRCKVTNGKTVFVDCDVDRGNSVVQLFTNKQRSGRYEFVGAVLVERR